MHFIEVLAACVQAGRPTCRCGDAARGTCSRRSADIEATRAFSAGGRPPRSKRAAADVEWCRAITAAMIREPCWALWVATRESVVSGLTPKRSGTHTQSVET